MDGLAIGVFNEVEVASQEEVATVMCVSEQVQCVDPGTAGLRTGLQVNVGQGKMASFGPCVWGELEELETPGRCLLQGDFNNEVVFCQLFVYDD